MFKIAKCSVKMSKEREEEEEREGEGEGACVRLCVCVKDINNIKKNNLKEILTNNYFSNDNLNLFLSFST